MIVLLRGGSPAPDVLLNDQIPSFRGTLIGMAVYAWIFFAVTLFVMKPVRTHKWWVGAMVNICIGISTICLAPLCIMMAIRWNSKEVKDYFNPSSFEV